MGTKSSRSHEPPAWAVELSGLVRARRKTLRLTQQQLAELAGVGSDFLYDLERGKPTVRLGTVMQVLDVLGVKVEYVARRSGIKAPGGDDVGRRIGGAPRRAVRSPP